MNNTDFKVSYDYLTEIYRNKAYLHVVLRQNSNKRVKKIVCGVLDKHFELNYILDEISDKKIKNNVRPLALVVLYAVKFLRTPVPVAIAETKDTLDSIGKSALKNYFVAIIGKVAKNEYKMPSKSDKRYVEVKYNLPSWLVGLYKKDYPDTFEEIIEAKEYPLSHVCLGKKGTEEEIFEADKDAKKTGVGYFVKKNKDVDMLAFRGKINFMSYCSALVAESVGAKDGMKILDCCAAPGGKSVYMAKKGAQVTACDIYDHRVDLIRGYAEKMGVGMDVYKQDATQTVQKWIGAFDAVLADVPCSGLGVTDKKRDIVLNRTYDDIVNLSKVQYDILENVCKYVKSGGFLIYSTCTVFSMENGKNIEKFLSSHDDFVKIEIEGLPKNDGEVQFLPDGKGKEGFYICKMKRL